MRTLFFLLALAIAPALLAQERIVVKMESEDGIGPLHFAWTGQGPATDPIGGQFNPLEDSVRGLPQGLTQMDVRFIDLQNEEAYRMGYLKGNVKKAQYDRLRRYYGASRPPDSVVFDQRLDYAVGKDAEGRYAVVFDTDNDEDLSDETVRSLPWDGPPMSIREFADSVMNTARYDELSASLPAIDIESETLIDGRIVPSKHSVLIMPFLFVPSPGPSIPDKRLYLLGYSEHRRGQVVVDDSTFDIWANSSEALFRPTSLWIQVSEPASFVAAAGRERPAVGASLRLGDVVKLGERRFRLDRMSLLGDRLELVDVTSRALVASGDRAPKVEAGTVGGERFDLEDLKGKYVLLDFWSADCGACFDQNKEEVYVTVDKSCIDYVGVSENTEEDIRDWTAARGISWSQLSDRSGQIGAAYGVSAYPTEVLVNPVGDVVSTLGRFDGPAAESAMLNRVLPAACYNRPTVDEVSSVFWADQSWTTPADYFVDGCTFAPEKMTVESVGDRNPEHGWPVTLDVSGECTPNASSDRQEPWPQDLTLNVWMYQNMGEWAFIAREPFVVERQEVRRP